jgi:primosomal replication protein N
MFFPVSQGLRRTSEVRSAVEMKDIINQIGSSIIGIATMEIKQVSIRGVQICHCWLSYVQKCKEADRKDLTSKMR